MPQDISGFSLFDLHGSGVRLRWMMLRRGQGNSLVKSIGYDFGFGRSFAIWYLAFGDEHPWPEWFNNKLNGVKS